MKKLFLIVMAFSIVLLLSEKNQIEEIIIPNDSIRIRIVANSNSNDDQELKIKVKNSIQKQLGEMLKDTKNIEEVRNVLKDNLKDVEYTVSKVIEKENNVSDNFNINYGYNYFPNKIYKGIKYDEGYYESVVVSLGESKGENWWCVLFPPLCLMDEEEEKMEEVEYKSFIKEIIEKYF